MSIDHQIPLRNARDRLINLLFQDIPTTESTHDPTFQATQQLITLPLRDLPVAVRAKVPTGETTTFYLLGGQVATDYLLCDEAGQVITADGTPILGQLLTLSLENTTLLHELRALIITPPATLETQTVPPAVDAEATAKFVHTWRQVIKITTPVIEQDQTFRVLARKAIQTQPSVGLTRLQNYLHQSVSFRVGIDTSLIAHFLSQAPTDELRDQATTIFIDFDQPQSIDRPLVVHIPQSQEGIHYQLLEETANGRIDRSEVFIGGQQGEAGDMNIELMVTGSLEEDTTLVVRAFRNENDRDNTDLLLAGDLEQNLQIRVRPKSTLVSTITANSIAYESSSQLELADIQASVDYQLFGRQVQLSEYAPEGQLEIAANEIADALPIGEKQSGAQGATLQFVIESVQEDQLFFVQATKRDPANAATLRIAVSEVLLVQPSPKPLVIKEAATIPINTKGMVIVQETQQGVHYQLMTGTTPVGQAGYHLTERAIGGTHERRAYGVRIGTDFKIGQEDLSVNSLYENGDLKLPTDPLDKATTFKVKAIKSYTGLEVKLEKGVRIKVENPDD